MHEDRIRRQIGQRLSLRTPQERALEILSDVLTHMDFENDQDLAALLSDIAKTYPSVEDFERDFPSLCFALATGVGKTRLMGAFISYLYLTGRSKNFFVLAPNTTIYTKLIDDFSKQSSPKYVFKGISQFAQTPPVIVTGDTWEEGRGVRGSDLFGGEAVINIFNVDKINKDKGRIKSFRETLGDSYFDYLSRLPDLVMLMDEAHRYRAKAGFKAIAELKPKLGIELTATPKTVGSNSKDFKNVIYHYGLGNAMADGYVKEPAVATRADFRKEDFSADQLEKIMLEDGVHYHEHVKAELDLFARQTNRARVHPFMLVVAQDTRHASDLKQLIESDTFFKGAYKDRVIEVHSNLRGDESDEAISRLVTLETDNRTEIVIHVNKLKEGWDVTNLYTIVPLRASASDILTEQTLGRGLRLPYGHRTGTESVDTLTVIAHDRFDDVIKKAREADSLVQIKQLTIGPGGDVSDEKKIVVDVPTNILTNLIGNQSTVLSAQEDEQTPYVFDTPEERRAVQVTLEFISSKYERRNSGGVKELITPETRKELVDDVRRALAPEQGTLDQFIKQPDLEGIIAQVTASVAENTIEIPEIIVIPSREVNFWFDDFDLSGLDAIHYQPLSDKIVIRNLRDQTQRELARSSDVAIEDAVENYIVKHLIDFDQVDYDTQADLLFKLARQAVEHLRSYLKTEEEVENVALSRGSDIARFIFNQMKNHYRETPADYKAKVVRSYRVLKEQSMSVGSLSKIVFINTVVSPLSTIKSYIFKGTTKSPFNFHKFDSDPERRFALMIDKREEKVLRWLKPGPGQFPIEYMPGKNYEPDFVVETNDKKLIVEIKAKSEMDDAIVKQKAKAANKWIGHANELAKESENKPWLYVIIPDDAVLESATLDGLISSYGMLSSQ